MIYVIRLNCFATRKRPVAFFKSHIVSTIVTFSSPESVVWFKFSSVQFAPRCLTAVSMRCACRIIVTAWDVYASPPASHRRAARFLQRDASLRLEYTVDVDSLPVMHRDVIANLWASANWIGARHGIVEPQLLMLNRHRSVGTGRTTDAVA